MRILICSKYGKPGYKAGKHGTCYTYNLYSDKSRNNALQRAYNERDEQEKHKKYFLEGLIETLFS